MYTFTEKERGTCGKKGEDKIAVAKKKKTFQNRYKRIVCNKYYLITLKVRVTKYFYV